MAVEDGAVLGALLGHLVKSPVIDPTTRHSHVPAVLSLYESLRKSRTTRSVQAAAQIKTMYQLKDGAESEARDRTLGGIDWCEWSGKCEWKWGNVQFLRELWGFDSVAEANDVFHNWVGSMDRE